MFTFLLSPPIERGSISEKVGVEVSEFEVRMYAGPNDFLGLGSTLTWQHAFWSGLFDGATCDVWRAFISNGVVVGTVRRFFGRVGDVEVGRTRIVIKIKSLLDLLTVQMPKRLFQSSCTFVFGDAQCSYNRTAGRNANGKATDVGAVDITCGSGSSMNSLSTSFAPTHAGSYDNGTIISTSGFNNGYTRTIASISGSTISFLKPWVFEVVAGVDTFQLLPGCDHTLATCTHVFKNEARYGGFPYIPPPETAV